MYPGWGGTGVGLEGYYTGYYPVTSRTPYLVIFSLRDPTHGRMKPFLEVSMRFLRYDLRMDPESTSEWTQNRPPRPIPDWSRDASSDPISRTSDILTSRIGLFKVLLTVADRIRVPSKDWIRPPTRCQIYSNGC